MRSIANGVDGFNGATDDVYLSPMGLCRKITRPSDGILPPQLRGKKRGKITAFSKGSARRLREVFFFKTVRGCRLAGITLTLPWVADGLEVINSEFKSAFKRFRMAFTRAFPHSALVWRVELQRNGKPHIHAVVMGSPLDGATDDANGCLMWVEVTHQWEHAVLASECALNFDGFMRHGTQFQPVKLEDNPIRLYRYLVDHASKHKESQLGWEGRQWGVLGSENLSPREDLIYLPGEVFRTDHERAVFWRMIRKSTRYRLNDARCPFGSRLSHGRQYGVIFGISPNTAKIALDFALSRGRWADCV